MSLSHKGEAPANGFERGFACPQIVPKGSGPLSLKDACAAEVIATLPSKISHSVQRMQDDPVDD